VRHQNVCNIFCVLLFSGFIDSQPSVVETMLRLSIWWAKRNYVTT
jgi:hypothetical protein